MANAGMLPLALLSSVLALTWAPILYPIPTPTSTATTKTTAAVTGSPAFSRAVGYYALSDGTVTGGTFKVQHQALADTQDIRLVYGNWTWGISGETAGPSSLTVKASVQYPTNGGTPAVYPVMFGGKRSVTIDPGALVVSDPVPLEVKKGDFIYSATYVTVPSAGQFPLGVTAFVNIGEGGDESTSPVDKTLNPGSVTVQAMQVYSPLAILGHTASPIPSVMLLGDSIIEGYYEAPAYPDWGFGTRGLNGAYIPSINMGRSGDTAQGAVGFKARQFRMQVAGGFTHCAVEYGTNDLYANGRTLSQLKSDIQDLWSGCTMRGLKIIAMTLTPRTAAATDGSPPVDSGIEAIRVAYNDWIRTKPSPVVLVWDTAKAVEANSSGVLTMDGGYWFHAFTQDGTHPTTAGHAAMMSSAAIDFTKVVP